MARDGNRAVPFGRSREGKTEQVVNRGIVGRAVLVGGSQAPRNLKREEAK